MFNSMFLRSVSTLSRRLNILAIESSADDTCAAVVNSSRQILSNVVIKQHDIHKQYGGIQPIEAIHEHQRNMPLAVKRALTEAGIDIVNDVHGIAFTRGPGMPGCLSVACNAAKTLAIALDKPLVGVHHMQGHALTSILTTQDPPRFPFLTLLVSGGHTLLLLASSNVDFKILATTADEAAGRCIDRVARLMGLEWKALGPGAALEQLASEDIDSADIDTPTFPKPMLGQLAFSFAGFHSYMDIYLRNQGGIESFDIQRKRRLARAFQASVFAHLEEKLLLALAWCTQANIHVQDIVVSGGVASNSCLRKRLQECLDSTQHYQNMRLVFPPASLCTDNAVMIAWASMHRFLTGDHDDYAIIPRPKWSIEEL
ncbi:hypothetical protein AGABI1DRAFT_112575 [Agaricus bisporus var. burnettii JB137-S8]|uniref:N(6)-L-threonylcarbamoyladenine synthase n=1 Tax=Agaricus bisporus var. burnettii (strain JB137-S8 / ATCC MYA-4627 / FGSC 10392) TaxID=597362 RepID=K5W217_AGABU|nr:uncharacterized protein AGABI1DRAFT_112575 [Agaricus bisporus var. burnettii JB137-S8]EKM80844.1 hypothetical protein AGABI1DRAFT_112575 [Agaricus bisporus var. burnettii JB137-S8]